MDKNSKINVQNRSILCENWLKRCSLNIFQRAFLNDLAQKWSIMVENCPLSRIHFCKMGLFFPKNGQYSRPATMKKIKMILKNDYFWVEMAETSELRSSASSLLVMDTQNTLIRISYYISYQLKYCWSLC